MTRNKNTKIILFAGLILTLIIPVVGINTVLAAPNTNDKCPDVKTTYQGKQALQKLEEKLVGMAEKIEAEENRFLSIAKIAYDKGDMIKAMAAIEKYDNVLAEKLKPIQKCGKAIEDKLSELKQSGVEDVMYYGGAPIIPVGSPTSNLDFDMDKVHIDCGLNWNTFHTDGLYVVTTDEFSMDNNTWPSKVKGWTGFLQCGDKNWANPIYFIIARATSGIIVCQYEATVTNQNSPFDTSCSNSFEDISYSVTMTSDYGDESRPSMTKLITLS